MHARTYFHDVASVEGRFNLCGMEMELEPGNVMGCKFNNITLVGVLERIMEVIIDIRNTSGEVVSGSDGKNQTYYRCR